MLSSASFPSLSRRPNSGSGTNRAAPRLEQRVDASKALNSSFTNSFGLAKLGGKPSPGASVVAGATCGVTSTITCTPSVLPVPPAIPAIGSPTNTAPKVSVTPASTCEIEAAIEAVAANIQREIGGVPSAKRRRATSIDWLLGDLASETESDIRNVFEDEEMAGDVIVLPPLSRGTSESSEPSLLVDEEDPILKYAASLASIPEDEACVVAKEKEIPEAGQDDLKMPFDESKIGTIAETLAARGTNYLPNDGQPDALAEAATPEPESKYIVPTELDVLLGRGGLTNSWAGNKKYRALVESVKPMYDSCSTKAQKKDVSILLLEWVKEYGGRFLSREEDENGTECYVLATYDAARKKASQALREGREGTKRKRREEVTNADEAP